jgi:hypothetical protein
MNIIAVIPGAETGVELADRLSFRMVCAKFVLKDYYQ